MADLAFAKTDAEAQRLYELYRDQDPFEGEIPSALLHMEHVRRYVAKTGMIWPFDDSPQHRKIATYEVRLKGKCIYWDEDGEKVVLDMVEGKEFKLKQNSIAFLTLEPKFRLPNYIAVRFNLKITHVYRGLLAGTGPLVDPGYTNYLFLPLHNLTANDYILRGGEPLVWMEFTKVSQLSEAQRAEFSGRGLPIPTPEAPKDLEFYLAKADPNRSIRSSIPPAIASAVKVAREARSKVDRLEWWGVIAILVAVIGAVWPIVTLVREVNQTNMAAMEKIDEVRRLQSAAAEQNRELERRLAALEKRASKSLESTKAQEATKSRQSK